MSARNEAKTAIAEFVHRNESIHRHQDLGALTCSYCNLVAHYAVSVLVNDPGLLTGLISDLPREPVGDGTPTEDR